MPLKVYAGGFPLVLERKAKQFNPDRHCLPKETIATGAPNCPECRGRGMFCVCKAEEEAYYVCTLCDCGIYTKETITFKTVGETHKALMSIVTLGSKSPYLRTVFQG